jgi:inosose dehydratase
MIRFGNAPTSWGIEKPADPAYPPWQSVLDQVAEAGYDGVELGPRGYFPDRPEELSNELSKRHLALSAANVMAPLADSATTEQLLRDADLTCELAGALGASYYVIIDGITPDREQTAGRSEDAVRLDRVAWRTLTDTVGRLAEIAADHGLVAAFHPHAGTRVEFRDEIERLLGDTDPSLVHLCVDTGHSTYAGIDPVELCRSHAARLAYVHLKDVTLPVLERARLDKVGFWEAYRRGVFCVLGRGSVDFVGLRDCLRDLRYDGWLTVEQDASPTGHSVPLEDAMASRKFLADTGFGAFRSDADPGGRK